MTSMRLASRQRHTAARDAAMYRLWSDQSILGSEPSLALGSLLLPPDRLDVVKSVEGHTPVNAAVADAHFRCAFTHRKTRETEATAAPLERGRDFVEVAGVVGGVDVLLHDVVGAAQGA